MTKKEHEVAEGILDTHSGNFFPIPKNPQRELQDMFTGELFQPKARNHYEDNDGKPFAPAVALNRPTIRQRIENLLNRDPDIINRYVREGSPDGTDGYTMDVPDDPEADLTPSEQNHIDMVAAELAEAAPFPDEGLPRAMPQPPSEVPPPPPAPAPAPAGVSSPPPAPAPAPVPGPQPRTVPTR